MKTDILEFKKDPDMYLSLCQSEDVEIYKDGHPFVTLSKSLGDYERILDILRKSRLSQMEIERLFDEVLNRI